MMQPLSSARTFQPKDVHYWKCYLSLPQASSHQPILSFWTNSGFPPHSQSHRFLTFRPHLQFNFITISSWKPKRVRNKLFIIIQCYTIDNIESSHHCVASNIPLYLCLAILLSLAALYNERKRTHTLKRFTFSKCKSAFV